MKRTLLSATSITAGCVLLYFAFKGIALENVAENFFSLRLTYLVYGMLAIILSSILRSILLKTIINASAPVAVLPIFKGVLVGNLGNSIFPARMGDLLRIYFTSKFCKLSRVICFASILIEKFFDVLMLTVFLSVTGLLLSLPTAFDNGIVYLVLAITIILALGLCIVFLGNNNFDLRSVVSVRNVSRLTVFKKFHIQDNVKIIYQCISSVCSPKKITVITIVSLLTWSLLFVHAYCLMLAFSLELPIETALILVTLLNLSFLIPTTPGNIGVYQYICIFTLSYFGVDKGVALSFSLFLQASDLLPGIVGGAYVLLTARKKDEIKDWRRDYKKL